MVKRKQTGWPVLGFLLFATVLAWFAKKQIWAPVKPVKRKDGLDRDLEGGASVTAPQATVQTAHQHPTGEA